MSAKTSPVLCLGAVLAVFGVYCVGVLDAAALAFAIGVVLLSCLLFGGLGRPGRGLVNVMLLIVSASLTLTVAELISRVALEEVLYYRPHEMLIREWPRYPQISRYVPDAHVSRETFGDLAAMIGDDGLQEKRRVVFTTDSHGFRNEPAAAGAVYDALILGDSFAVGNGTTQAKTWASLLNDRSGFRVYNLAIPGGPWQSYVNLALEIERLDLQPGAVILLALFTGNDLDDEYGPIEPGAPRLRNPIEAAAVRFSSYRRRSAIRQLSRRIGRTDDASKNVLRGGLPEGSETLLFYKPYVERRSRTARDLLEHENYPGLTGSLDAIRRIAESRSAGFEIALMPMKAEIYGWAVDGSAPWSASGEPSGWATALGELCRSRGIGFLDLKPLLAARAREEYERSRRLLWWRDDTHFNETGHEVVAELVAGAISP